ncbi:hypothetical protein BDV28DRAFT_81288 [Aspergillus coremiiformis]|uniref:Uncharacterized protein n=1 Tax=Aspergillus coremiiformis TaxID=138285 RepID=A0A5N6ZA36_9EURO|nr:hypothetical protein BDV28DRAFT_81288 [Aspergillus coremiiformis]
MKEISPIHLSPITQTSFILVILMPSLFLPFFFQLSVCPRVTHFRMFYQSCDVPRQGHQHLIDEL